MPRAYRIFTSQNLTRIRHMAEQGSSTLEIARTIGSTPGSVRVVCCHHKIRLVRRKRSVDPAPQTDISHMDRTPEHIIRAHMPAPLFDEFNRKAEQLQLSPSDLASHLLVAIATSNIYEAVLDDDD